MKTLIAALVPFLTGFLHPADSQDRRVVVISPRVGTVVDSAERATYRLFRTVECFHSATFYQTPDSAFWVLITRASGQAILADTTFSISFGSLSQYAEMIDHWEEVAGGSYIPGTSRPRMFYEGGTPVIPGSGSAAKPAPDGVLQGHPSGVPPPVSAKLPGASPDSSLRDDLLPLAPDTAGLARPLLPTIHMDMMLGVAYGDFGEVKQLNGASSDVFLPVSLLIHIPLTEEPSLSILAGWSLGLGNGENGGLFGGGGGTLTSFSALVLYQSTIAHSLDAIFGFGVGKTWYDCSGPFIVEAALTYPMFLCGVNIERNYLDVVLTVPMASRLQTTFESKTYSIRPTGPTLGLLLSLR